MRWARVGLIVVVFAGCKRRTLVTIKGSDTVLPVSQALVEAYLARHKAPLLNVTGGGSGVGIAALLHGDTDIAMSSRPLKLSEWLKFEQRRYHLIEDTVAWDVLAICVHPSLTLDRLTRAQIAAIYTGQVRNWKELGGPDLPILPYSRESSSGTFEFFREHVLLGKDFAEGVRFIPATGMLMQSVSQTPGAIGYLGIAYVGPQVKVLRVARDGDTVYYLPARNRAELNRYPLARPLYYYYERSQVEKLRPFLEFVHSPEGRAVVAQVGYVP